MESNFRICRDCSTRNRLDKEFCVKCGESLEGIPSGDPNATQIIGRPQQTAELIITDREDKSPLVATLVALIALSALFAAWRILMEKPAEATPEGASRPLIAAPEALPSSSVATPAPGIREYSAGMAARQALDYATAVRFFSAAVAAVPNRADYQLALAEALEKSGSTDAALAAYETAAGLEPSKVRYAGEWAKALNRAGRYPEAIRVYEAALALDPENIANLREVANLQMKSNNFASARPHLEKISALQPNDLLPKQDLARALEATNDLKGAIEQYRAILTAMPDAEVSRALLSEVFMKDNRSAEALSMLDEGLALNPSSSALYREKGRIYDRLGDNAKAIAAYRDYLRVAPTGPDARVLRDRIAQLVAISNPSNQ